MKRLIILPCLLIFVALFATVTALMQDSRPQLGNRDSSQVAPSADALSQKQLNQNRLHKLIINSEDPTYGELMRLNAIRSVIDYGSFKLVVVDQEPLGVRAAIEAMPGNWADEMDRIELNGYVIDTSAPQLISREMPTDLKLSRMAEARSRGDAPVAGLYIVKFVGPIKDAWLETLKSTGAHVVSYVANNAYVVSCDARSAALVSRLQDEEPSVQWVGDYEPGHKMTRELAAARAMGDASYVKVTIQVLAEVEGSDQLVFKLRSYSRQPISESRVMNYRNITAVIPASLLPELAKSDVIFAIERVTERRRLDEAQGQIVAGNLSGNSPTGPGYLAWLASKGFDSSQFGSFSVNVADDAFSLIGHPDLPNARIAFNNNPTAQAGAQGGHGFLNAHIVGGFNNGTGSAFEDANGFNYGLGIAPWARVGVTAIFGNGASSPTAWENTAYGQGARISSNSWGFINLFRYDATAQEVDRIVRDAQSGVAGNQQMTVIFAAGNDGSGANTVSSPGTAKNIISVGAGENVRMTGNDGCGIGNTGADSANDIIGFSSRGPVNSAGGDGRIKPDIVAPGTHIEAGIPQSNYDGSSVCNQFFPPGQTLYGWSSGTSHSTPAVAGGAALLYQFFLNSGLSTPSPAMAKAYLMNSAAYMTGVGAGGNLPSNSQGMGRMDLGRAFDTTPRMVADQTTTLGATGQTFQVTGSVATTSQPFRVTLAYSDAPGPTTGSPVVNNLDLEVTVGGQTYRGNVFSGPNSTTGGASDPRNNAESVFLPAGTSGNFTVTVRAANIAGDGVPGNADTTDQDFALVIYNGTAAAPTQPTIGVNPASLSFTATAGGSNPASQAINVTNTGGGTLNFTVSDNAPWLTVSPASGTAPATLTASVDITGLAAGTFNGTITINGDGATNTPVSVPVTLTVNGAGGNELIVNGGFEGGAAPWTLTGGAVVSTGGNHRSGVGYLILGGVNNASQSAFQQITIPSGTSPSLNFWLNVTSTETTTTTQFDRFFVEVRSTSGALLATLATFSNLNRVAATNAYTLRGPLNLSSFAGQTVRIQFRATTDVSLITSFRVDDVSVR
ncbi:MAG TPA: S8 family serine peptidase [Blastocatellia bacterium]|nr:S8 family serine peptidase [Blastocatellia bacterium]